MGQILQQLVQSVSFRTAGFASVPQEKLTEISCMIGYILMFIGGSPIGTAGGVKTVTAFLVIMNAYSYINGRKETVIFHRSVSAEMMRKAAAIVAVSASVLLTMTVLLMAVENIELTDACYEITSALGTVGLSRALTTEAWRARKNCGQLYRCISVESDRFRWHVSLREM